MIFRNTYLKRNDKTPKKLSLILFLPFLLGPIESKLPKNQELITVSNQITINVNKSIVWNNLLEIPDLSKDITPNFLTDIGIPKPQYSTYDKAENVRLGYFNNGIVLYEKVKSSTIEKELTLEILMDKSILTNSPTLIHVPKNKGIEFESIQYQLEEVDENTTILTLNCAYYLNTNLIYYGKFWSKLILNDFENNLLKGLKHNIENNDN